MKINETAMSKSYQHPEEGLSSMKTATRLIALTLLLAGTFFVSSTLACTTDAWLGGATAGTLADDPTNGVPRLSGLCGLEVTGSGHVIDNSPTAETTFIGRFYVFPKALPAGTHVLFTAYSDEAGTKLFDISYNGSVFTIDANAAGGNSVIAAADTTHWNLVEFSWTSGGLADSGKLWVNADATTEAASASFTPGTGSVEQVRMGAEAGIGTDKVVFDDYESHRSLPVGSLLIADSNGNGSINVFDLISIQNEILGNSLANGQPDCNLNGGINVFDLICTQNTILGN